MKKNGFAAFDGAVVCFLHRRWFWEVWKQGPCTLSQGQRTAPKGMEHTAKLSWCRPQGLVSVCNRCTAHCSGFSKEHTQALISQSTAPRGSSKYTTESIFILLQDFTWYDFFLYIKIDFLLPTLSFAVPAPPLFGWIQDLVSGGAVGSSVRVLWVRLR